MPSFVDQKREEKKKNRKLKSKNGIANKSI